MSWIVGYLKVPWRAPCFVVPVFEDEAGLWVEENDLARGIFRTLISADETEFTARHAASVQNGRCYGFAFSDQWVEFGTKEQIASSLKTHISLLDGHTLTLAHVYAFFGEPEVAKTLRAKFKNETIARRPCLAGIWAGSAGQVPEPVRGAVANVAVQDPEASEIQPSIAENIDSCGGRRAQSSDFAAKLDLLLLRIGMASACLTVLFVLFSAARFSLSDSAIISPSGAGILTVFFGAATAFLAYRFRLEGIKKRNDLLEEKVRLRTQELEAASAAKTDFVANMSHDIRNPLNGIVGLTLALEDSRLDHRQREIVATLRECTTYLSSLVDDVLDFASIEAGRVELRPSPFVAGELIHSIVTTLKADADERGATFTCDVGPGLPSYLLGDAGRIQQILVNFASNALKYAGGHIRLSVTIPNEAPEEVEFAVADEGPGISEQECATLFTKFTRLKVSRDSNIPGAGLGLAACRLLADIMGGAVGVSSVPGMGARFFLRLPLTVATGMPAWNRGELPEATVLLVEDTDYNAWAASAVLARLGLCCDRARDGAEAIRMFETRRYNVVLLDRNLPDMDGTEVARRLRSITSSGSQALVLAVTAYCTAQDRALCLAAGMDAFVGKPLTPDKLRRVLLGAGKKLLATGPAPESSSSSSSAALDISLLTYLSDGEPGRLAVQIRRFVTAMKDLLGELTLALDAGNFSAARIAAHRLLGQARIVGGAAVARVASQLEDVAVTHDSRECARVAELLTQEVLALSASLEDRALPWHTSVPKAPPPEDAETRIPSITPAPSGV